jgi:hypothetical protein
MIVLLLLLLLRLLAATSSVWYTMTVVLAFPTVFKVPR